MRKKRPKSLQVEKAISQHPVSDGPPETITLFEQIRYGVTMVGVAGLILLALWLLDKY